MLALEFNLRRMVKDYAKDLCVSLIDKNRS